MIAGEKLNQREELILEAVVQTYIATAEAVGSRSIVKRFGLDVSPATVRNVMADLEDAGYLQQLHTSSGRVPTNLGYRYYIDYLMRVQELTPAEQARIDRELSRMMQDAQEVMRHTSQLLAVISHHPGIVEAPDDSGAEVRHIEIMPVSQHRVAIVVADSYGSVRTMLVGLDAPLPDGVIPKLNRFLNEQAEGGTTFSRLSQSIQLRLETLLDEEHRLAETAMRLLGMMPRQQAAQVFLEGAAQLFEQPEFHDLDRARKVFAFLEERQHLAEILRARLLQDDAPPFTVLIGSEMETVGVDEISVVASPYRVGSQTVGVLGVVGPRRMPYGRLSSVVGYTAGSLSRLLTRMAG